MYFLCQQSGQFFSCGLKIGQKWPKLQFYPRYRRFQTSPFATAASLVAFARRNYLSETCKRMTSSLRVAYGQPLSIFYCTMYGLAIRYNVGREGGQKFEIRRKGNLEKEDHAEMVVDLPGAWDEYSNNCTGRLPPATEVIQRPGLQSSCGLFHLRPAAKVLTWTLATSLVPRTGTIHPFATAASLVAFARRNYLSETCKRMTSSLRVAYGQPLSIFYCTMYGLAIRVRHTVKYGVRVKGLFTDPSKITQSRYSSET
ncbi:hypothetical protein DFH28DRAFT_939351 [Melampsora americana]|nr:hypothetical protein DFH28DRAFT_939351 [Melampsora americana]